MRRYCLSVIVDGKEEKAADSEITVSRAPTIRAAPTVP